MFQAAVEHRRPQHQQQIAQDGSGYGGAHDFVHARLQGQQGDNQFGNIAESGVHQAAPYRTGVDGIFLGGLADYGHRAQDGQGGGYEKPGSVHSGQVQPQGNRKENQQVRNAGQGGKKFIPHGSIPVIFAFALQGSFINPGQVSGDRYREYMFMDNNGISNSEGRRLISRGMACAALAALLFGLATPVAKWLLGRVEPLPMAGLLYLGSGIGLSLLAFFRRLAPGRGVNRLLAGEAGLTRFDLPWLAGTILAGGVAAPVLMMWGLSLTSGSAGSLLLNLEGVLTAILACLLFREAVGSRVWGAAALMALGGGLISWMPQSRLDLPLGSLLVLGACLMWGLDNNLTRHLSAKDPLYLAMLKGLAAGSTTLLLARAANSPLPTASTMIGVMLLGSVGWGLSLVLFIHALRHLGAARTGAVFGVAPFIGAAASLAFLGDPLTWPLFGAGCLMGLGAWLLLKEEHEHEHVHENLYHEHRHVHDLHHLHHQDTAPRDPHSHFHHHARLAHSHPHAPDLHHRHRHVTPGISAADDQSTG